MSSLIPGTIMLESGEEVTIDIDATVSCKSSSNTLEITLKREREVILIKERKYGPVEILGSNIAPPFPIPHILLNDMVSFHRHKIHSLLYSTLQDHILCDNLSGKISSEAKRVPGPLHMSLHVTVTPHRIIEEFSSVEKDPEEEEICVICLEELFSTGEHVFHLQNCAHGFHDSCISLWLCENDTCPTCRTVVEDDDEDESDGCMTPLEQSHVEDDLF